MDKEYNLGDWITSGGNILQIIYIRPCYVELYSQEYYKGKKAGEYLYDLFVCKTLCDINGKLKKKNRFAIVNAEYCNLVSKKYLEIVETIKQNDKESYRDYLVYDDKRDLGESLVLKFMIDEYNFPKVEQQIYEISLSLKGAFTLSEFIKVAEKSDFTLDMKNLLKDGPIINSNFSIVLFNRLYKVVNKQYVYTKIWTEISRG